MHRRVAVAALGAGGLLAYSWLAAATRPFTVPADVVTAVPVAVGFGLGLRAVVARHAPAGGTASTGATHARRARHVRRAGRAGSALAGAAPAWAAPVDRPSMWPWVAALSLLAAWELAVYAAGLADGRRPFPTVSSLYDEVAHVHEVKAALFALWLVLGWALSRS